MTRKQRTPRLSRRPKRTRAAIFPTYRRDVDISNYPTGSYMVQIGERLVLMENCVSYQVSGDGDLVLRSRRGLVHLMPARMWNAIGTLERQDGVPWVAFERFSPNFMRQGRPTPPPEGAE